MKDLNIARKSTPGAHPVRVWSNQELKKISNIFTGDVVNISGWEDKDKEGGHYREYFPKSNSYTVTNFSSSHIQGSSEEIILDITKPLAEDLMSRFDVVFSHTNLEHIFDVFTAFKNHCLMSRDIVIIVVPFVQQQHETSEYKDYWRFTPSCLRALFEINGLTTIYESFNDEPGKVTYLLFVGSKQPSNWEGKLPSFEHLQQICDWVS